MSGAHLYFFGLVQIFYLFIFIAYPWKPALYFLKKINYAINISMFPWVSGIRIADQSYDQLLAKSSKYPLHLEAWIWWKTQSAHVGEGFQFIADSLTVYWADSTQYGFRVGTNSPPGVGLTPSAKGKPHNTLECCYKICYHLPSGGI